MARTQTAPLRELLSPRAFGLTLSPKVSRQAVQQAIAAGRLAKSSSQDDRGNWKIDAAAGRDEWEAWTDPAKRRKEKPPGRPGPVEKTPNLFEAQQAEQTRVEHEQRIPLARARTSLVSTENELRLLELQQRRGELVERAEVDRQALTLARSVRDRLLSIPDGAAAALAAMTSPGQVHERLMRELESALEELTREELPA